MFIQYLQVQHNAAIVLSHWHGRRRIFQLCARTGEGKREGGELGPSQGGQKHPWTPTLIYALMMRLWKVLTLITDFLAWSVNSALESSWLGTNPFQMCCFWYENENENYKLDKPNKSLKMTRGFTSFIEAQAKQTWGQQIPISTKHQRVHCVWMSFKLCQ